MNVLRVDNITDLPAVHRDLALIKVASTPEARAQIMRSSRCSARASSTSRPTSLVLEITGTEDKIDAFVETLRPYGVLEMGRTGRCR